MNNIVPFEQGGLPAHLQGKPVDNTEFSSGVAGGYAILSLKGKVWHIVQNGERTLVTRPDDPNEPATSLLVVLLRANKHLSKLYYKNGYVDGSAEKPDCYSNDGITPALDAQERQAEKCAVCPHNAWGSKVSENGSKVKACSDSRRVAVCPAGSPDAPMLLRVPAASLRDLGAYADMLAKRGAAVNAVVTRMSFDHSVAHPKLVFKPEGWLDADAYSQVLEATNSDLVEQIVAVGTGVETGGAPEPDTLGEAPAHVKAAAKPAPAPAAAKPAPAATKPVAAQAAKPTTTSAAAAAAFGGAKPEAAKPAQAAQSHQPPADEVDAGLQDILAGANEALASVLADLD
jgi:hypothetical protein